jgi:hypothetical protein
VQLAQVWGEICELMSRFTMPNFGLNALHQKELVKIANLPETRRFRKIPEG